MLFIEKSLSLTRTTYCLKFVSILHNCMWVLLSATIYVCAQNLNSFGWLHQQGICISDSPFSQLIGSHHGVVVSLWYNPIICTALVMTMLVPVSWQADRHVPFWHNCVKGIEVIASSCDANHGISTFSRAKYCWFIMFFSWMIYRQEDIRLSFWQPSLSLSTNGSVLSRQDSGFHTRFVRLVSLMLCTISTASLVRLIASVFVWICCVTCMLFCIITKIPANHIDNILILMSISMMVNHFGLVFCFLLVIAIQKIISK